MKTIAVTILSTLIFIIGIELIVSWIFIAITLEIQGYYVIFQFIQGLLQLTAVLIFTYLVRKKSFKNLIASTAYKWYLIGFILGVIFVFIQTPLNWCYNYLFSSQYSIRYNLDGFPTLFDLNIIPLVFFIPIAEELFFRGYIQNILQKKLNVYIAIIIASVLFASIHAPYSNLFTEYSNQDWHSFYITLFGGAISGILYFKSKSIGPSIIFHIFWNLMVLIV
ncbi:CPBP family intramembrane glutamic endopeptidase [Crocinitomix catalasitica]|uniref:CPBP family intramembrane glutamic endopeptidase n=1 Tax=Crocinitomix catalasitica TaxID=184607 RepID=UPI000483C32E|nr:type II CAAX endopeptidase family protein [Crocinitomix catalasitica]